MSQLPPDAEKLSRRCANAVDDAVSIFLSRHGAQDHAMTARPQIYPAAGENWEAICAAMDERLYDADGLVAILFRPTTGVGIELEIALRAGIPLLVLSAQDSQSPRVAGRLDGGFDVHREEIDFDASPVEVRRAILAAVDSWLEHEFDRIRDTRRRRRMVESRLSRFLMRVRLADADLSLAPTRRRVRLAVAGVSETRANQLQSSPRELAFAGVSELVALSTAYGIPLNLDFVDQRVESDRPLHITDAEFAALEEVVRVDRLQTMEAVQMVAIASRRLAHGGRRRIRLTAGVWREIRRELWERRSPGDPNR